MSWITARIDQVTANANKVAIDQTTIGTTNKVHDGWTPSLQAEETANDSDKTFTVPASTEWQPLSIRVELATTADAGDRQIAILFTDGSDDVIGEVRAGAVQAASLTRYYEFAIGNDRQTSFLDTDHLPTPLPVIILPAGYKIRVFDNNAVQAAADDMVIQMVVMARSV